jgi:hypothetical protein
VHLLLSWRSQALQPRIRQKLARGEATIEARALQKGTSALDESYDNAEKAEEIAQIYQPEVDEDSGEKEKPVEKPVNFTHKEENELFTMVRQLWTPTLDAQTKASPLSATVPELTRTRISQGQENRSQNVQRPFRNRVQRNPSDQLVICGRLRVTLNKRIEGKRQYSVVIAVSSTEQFCFQKRDDERTIRVDRPRTNAGAWRPRQEQQAATTTTTAPTTSATACSNASPQSQGKSVTK